MRRRRASARFKQDFVVFAGMGSVGVHAHGRAVVGLEADAPSADLLEAARNSG